MSVDKSSIIAEAKKRITEGYDLPEDFINSIDKALSSVLGKHHIYDTPQVVEEGAEGGGKGKKAKPTGPQKPRKIGAYAYFVKEKMPSVKDTPPKERMGAISKLWKVLSDEEKEPYQKQANDAHTEALAKYEVAVAEAAKESETQPENAE